MMAVAEFGKDISCTDSLRTGRYATKARLIGESAYRRLTTPRGMLRGGEEEQDYGLDLSSLIGGSRGTTAASLPGRIRTELMKDERIISVDVDLVETTSGAETSFGITIEVHTAEGPFTLAIAVEELTVELLGIKAEV